MDVLLVLRVHTSYNKSAAICWWYSWSERLCFGTRFADRLVHNSSALFEDIGHPYLNIYNVIHLLGFCPYQYDTIQTERYSTVSFLENFKEMLYYASPLTNRISFEPILVTCKVRLMHCATNASLPENL